MAWTSGIFNQNGNTTVNWLWQHPDATTRDCVVINRVSGNSHIRTIWVEQRTVSRLGYVLRVQVIGAGAVSFRLSAEAMN